MRSNILYACPCWSNRRVMPLLHKSHLYHRTYCINNLVMTIGNIFISYQAAYRRNFSIVNSPVIIENSIVTYVTRYRNTADSQ